MFFLFCQLLQPLSPLAWLQSCQWWCCLHCCHWVDCWLIQFPPVKVTHWLLLFLVLPAPCHCHCCCQHAFESLLQFHCHTIATIVAAVASSPLHCRTIVMSSLLHQCCHIIVINQAITMHILQSQSPCHCHCTIVLMSLLLLVIAAATSLPLVVNAAHQCHHHCCYVVSVPSPYHYCCHIIAVTFFAVSGCCWHWCRCSCCSHSAWRKKNIAHKVIHLLAFLIT